jgi:hypothetical protein
MFQMGRSQLWNVPDGSIDYCHSQLWNQEVENPEFCIGCQLIIVTPNSGMF